MQELYVITRIFESLILPEFLSTEFYLSTPKE